MNQTRSILAVDPGRREGAAVLFADRVLVAAFVWRPYKAGSELLRLQWFQLDKPVQTSVVVTAYRVGSLVTAVATSLGAKPEVIMEGTFLGKSPKVAMDLARWSGAFAGPLEDIATRTRWVAADDWREQGLGIKRFTARDSAKAQTAELLPEDMKSQMEAAAKRLGGVKHLADAVGIAVWGLGDHPDRVPKPKKKAKSKQIVLGKTTTRAKTKVVDV